MKLQIELDGGLELICGNKKSHSMEFQGEGPITMVDVIEAMKTQVVTERVDLFSNGKNVRAGILVLINDEDWELHGALEYQVENNDTIVFISTLHGG